MRSAVAKIVESHEEPGAGQPLDVYLVPISHEGYELYSEMTDEGPPDEEEPRGFFRGLTHRFRVMVATAEQERRRRTTDSPPPEGSTWMRRMRDRASRWVAEAIAEQRLLWRLRRQVVANIVYPADLTAERATSIVRTRLRDDGDKHRLWLIVDGLGLLASAVLALIPGPNLLAYYFAFRVVGHYLSYRGARRGLESVEWHRCPSAPLAELRAVLDLPAAQRRLRVCDISRRLGLEHLEAFFERTALPGA
jgi:hypothetical protein